MSSGEIDAIDRYWRAANYGPAPGISEAGVAGANARESISNVLGQRLVGGGRLEQVLKLRHLLADESRRVGELVRARGW